LNILPPSSSKKIILPNDHQGISSKQRDSPVKVGIRAVISSETPVNCTRLHGFTSLEILLFKYVNNSWRRFERKLSFVM
jgi:hypothetical protein